MASTDPQSLFAWSKCFACHGASVAELMELALLDKIRAGLEGGGVGGGVICGAYAGQPTFTPASGCGVAIDTTTDIIYWYYSGAWHP